VNNRRLLEIAEYVALFGSGFGSVASVLSQQMVYASAPLSFCLLLSIVNRRRLDQAQQTEILPAIDQLQQQLDSELTALHQVQKRIATLPTPETLDAHRAESLRITQETVQVLATQLNDRLALVEQIDLEAINRQIAGLEARCQALQQDLGEAMASLADRAPIAQVTSLVQDVTQLATQQQHLHKTVSELAEAPDPGLTLLSDRLDTLQSEILQRSRAETYALVVELENLRRELDHLAKDHTSHHSALNQLTTEVETLQTHQHSLSQTTLELDVEMTALAQQLAALAHAAHREHEQQQIHALRQAILKLSRGCTRLQQQIHQTRAATRATTPNTVWRGLIAAELKPVQQQLDQLRQDLTQVRGVLPDRAQLEPFEQIQSTIAQVEHWLHDLRKRTQNIEALQEATQTQVAELSASNAKDPDGLADGSFTSPSAELDQLRDRVITLETFVKQFQSHASQPEACLQNEAISQSSETICQQPVSLLTPAQCPAKADHLNLAIARSETDPIDQAGLTLPLQTQPLALPKQPSPEKTANLGLSLRSALREVLDQIHHSLTIAGSWLTQPWLDEELERSLKAAVRRGVEVTFVLSLHGDHWASCAIRRFQSHSAETHTQLPDQVQLTALARLSQIFPNQIQIQFSHLHTSFLVCDRAFAILGQVTMAKDQTKPLEQGAIEVRTSDPQTLEMLYGQLSQPLPIDQPQLLQARAALRQLFGDQAGAIADYTNLLAHDPTQVVFWNNRALLHYQDQNWSAAIADLDQALLVNSGSGILYANRAAVRAEIEDWHGAIADYTQAIAHQPDDDIAYNNRGLLYSKLGDKHQAIADYTQAIALRANDDVAYFNRGAARSNLGDYRGAIADYSAAIRINPQFANAHNNRGFAYQKLDDRRAALADFDRALQLDPYFANAYNNRGITRARAGDLRGAIADFSRAIQINPEFVNAYNNRGTLRSKLGDLNAAITDFSQAIQIRPDFANAYSNRGLAHAEAGEYGAALADLTQADQLFSSQGDQASSQQTRNLQAQLQQASSAA